MTGGPEGAWWGGEGRRASQRRLDEGVAICLFPSNALFTSDVSTRCRHVALGAETSRAVPTNSQGGHFHVAVRGDIFIDLRQPSNPRS